MNPELLFKINSLQFLVDTTNKSKVVDYINNYGVPLFYPHEIAALYALLNSTADGSEANIEDMECALDALLEAGAFFDRYKAMDYVVDFATNQFCEGAS